MSDRVLLLMRHAEAEAFAPGRSDRDRALTARGREQATRTGVHLAESGLSVDLVLCSPARRTRQTLEQLGLPPGVESCWLESIYDAGSDTLLGLVAELPADVDTVLMVGHAPGVPRLAAELAGPGSDARALSQLERGFPTASSAQLTLSGEWNLLAPGSDPPSRLDRLYVGA